MRLHFVGFGIATLLCAACSGVTETDAGMDAGSAARDDAGHDAGSVVDARLDTGAQSDASCVDADGDGSRATACGGDDCDDADARRYPGNTEVCDATNRDEDCDPATFGFRDADMDGVADSACCNVDTAGARRCGADCNDADTNVRPSQTEACNGVDDNCNAMIDEGVLVSFYADCDGDNYGAGTPMVRCTPPTAAPAGCPAGRWVTVSGDCDDTMAGVSPGAMEVCDRGGLDEDCNPATLGPDGDGDGAPATSCCNLQTGGPKRCGTDCNDAEAAIRAGATERCNGIDDDCDRVRDDGLTGCMASVSGTGTVPCASLFGPSTVCSLATSICCRLPPQCTTAFDCLSNSAGCDGPEDCPGAVCCDSSSGAASCSGSCDPMTQFPACHEDADCAASQVCVPILRMNVVPARGCLPI